MNRIRVISLSFVVVDFNELVKLNDKLYHKGYNQQTSKNLPSLMGSVYTFTKVKGNTVIAVTMTVLHAFAVARCGA